MIPNYGLSRNYGVDMLSRIAKLLGVSTGKNKNVAKHGNTNLDQKAMHFGRPMFDRSFFYSAGSPIWMNREYSMFSEEAYIKNVIAHRSIDLVSRGAASIPMKLYVRRGSRKRHITKHPILSLLNKPNPSGSYTDFFECLYMYQNISGNSYVLAVLNRDNCPVELYSLRPDRVKVVAGKGYKPQGYQYEVGSNKVTYAVDPDTGKSPILHIKNFHPNSDWYGLSPIEAAVYSIEQHNQCGRWNQSLLQNGARPSGALIVKDSHGKPASLSGEQYIKLKNSIDEMFSSPQNAGRPLLLEGGLEWKEMSLSPKDMDYISSKNSSARDIALAFGVPPQLLGIPGDNTYSNLSEARIALWEQTIIPLADRFVNHFNTWISQYFGEDLVLESNIDKIPALAAKREVVWERVQKADFLTINEKREMVGFGPIKEGDRLESRSENK